MIFSSMMRILMQRKEPAALEVGTHKVQSEIACMHARARRRHPSHEGQSTASDKDSNDLLSLMTTWNTSKDLKKCGINVNQVILERMVAAHILWEFTPEAFNIEFKATMEEEEDVETPTLEANVHIIKDEGELKESILEVNMHHFYHGDPNEIHEFALQGTVAYESDKDDALAEKTMTYNSLLGTLKKTKRSSGVIGAVQAL
jgi:hypothetical protein